MAEALWIRERLALHAPICCQLPYNLATRGAEREFVPACLHFGLGITVFSPLAGSMRWGGAGFTREQVALAQQLDGLAAAWERPPAQLALAWLLSHPGVTSAIIGPETVAELEANAPAADLQLAPEQLERLDAVGRAEP